MISSLSKVRVNINLSYFIVGSYRWSLISKHTHTHTHYSSGILYFLKLLTTLQSLSNSDFQNTKLPCISIITREKNYALNQCRFFSLTPLRHSYVEAVFRYPSAQGRKTGAHTDLGNFHEPSDAHTHKHTPPVSPSDVAHTGFLVSESQQQASYSVLLPLPLPILPPPCSRSVPFSPPLPPLDPPVPLNGNHTNTT